MSHLDVSLLFSEIISVCHCSPAVQIVRPPLTNHTGFCQTQSQVDEAASRKCHTALRLIKGGDTLMSTRAIYSCVWRGKGGMGVGGGGVKCVMLSAIDC